MYGWVQHYPGRASQAVPRLGPAVMVTAVRVSVHVQAAANRGRTRILRAFSISAG